MIVKCPDGHDAPVRLMCFSTDTKPLNVHITEDDTSLFIDNGSDAKLTFLCMHCGLVFTVPIKHGEQTVIGVES